jgi:hypothetical protein
MSQLTEVSEEFSLLTRCRCSDNQFATILKALLPMPKKPASANRSKAALHRYENRVARVVWARQTIGALRESGKGMDLPTCRGTLWGALNAITEFVDHHQEGKSNHVGWSLLGEGSSLKTKAYQLIRSLGTTAA